MDNINNRVQVFPFHKDLVCLPLRLVLRCYQTFTLKAFFCMEFWGHIARNFWEGKHCDAKQDQIIG